MVLELISKFAVVDFTFPGHKNAVDSRASLVPWVKKSAFVNKPCTSWHCPRDQLEGVDISPLMQAPFHGVLALEIELLTENPDWGNTFLLKFSMEGEEHEGMLSCLYSS